MFYKTLMIFIPAYLNRSKSNPIGNDSNNEEVEIWLY